MLKPNYLKYMLFIPGYYGGKIIIQLCTNLAKEKALKRQFIEYATKSLRLAENSISANISNQVQQ